MGESDGTTWPGSDDHWGKGNRGFITILLKSSNKKLGKNGGKIYTSPTAPDAEYICSLLTETGPMTRRSG